MSTSVDELDPTRPSEARGAERRAAVGAQSERRRIGQPAPGESERTIGQLVADASHDLSVLVNSEIALAKQEVTKGIQIGIKGAGFLAAAGFLGLLGLIFLFHTLARVIGEFLPVWAGYGIVTLLLLLLAGLLGLMGLKKVKKAKPVPEKAIGHGKETVEALKSAT